MHVLASVDRSLKASFVLHRFALRTRFGGVRRNLVRSPASDRRPLFRHHSFSLRPYAARRTLSKGDSAGEGGEGWVDEARRVSIEGQSTSYRQHSCRHQSCRSLPLRSPHPFLDRSIDAIPVSSSSSSYGTAAASATFHCRLRCVRQSLLVAATFRPSPRHYTLCSPGHAVVVRRQAVLVSNHRPRCMLLLASSQLCFTHAPLYISRSPRLPILFSVVPPADVRHRLQRCLQEVVHQEDCESASRAAPPSPSACTSRPHSSATSAHSPTSTPSRHSSPSTASRVQRRAASTGASASHTSTGRSGW